MESENGNCGGDVGDITVSSLRYRRAARVVSIVELILNTILVVVVVVSVVILVSAFIYLESEGYVEEEAQNGEEEEQLGPQYIIGLAIELFILAVYVFLPFIASVALFRSTNKKSVSHKLQLRNCLLTTETKIETMFNLFSRIVQCEAD